jgi:energy-coupling factor transporter ATP-binding protein EcfA2
MIIALTGKKGSGKNTVAEVFKSLYPEKNFQLLSFAEPLKEAYEILYAEKVIDDLAWKEGFHPRYKIKRRKLMQDLGKFLRETTDGMGFVDRLFEKIKSGNNYIITDLRFKNEHEFLKNTFFTTFIRVVRKTGLNDADISETDLDDVVMTTIHNDSTIYDLRSKVGVITL